MLVLIQSIYFSLEEFDTLFCLELLCQYAELPLDDLVVGRVSFGSGYGQHRLQSVVVT